MKDKKVSKNLKIGRFLNSEIEINGLLLGEVKHANNTIKFVLERDSEIYHAFNCTGDSISEHKQALSLKQLMDFIGLNNSKELLESYGLPTETPIDLSFDDLKAGKFRVLENPYGDNFIFKSGEIISNKSVVNGFGHQLDLTVIEKPDTKFLVMLINHHDKATMVFNLSNEKSLDFLLRQQQIATEA